MKELKNLEKELKKRGYENLIYLGSGAFSSVYRIQDKESGQLLACKVSEACSMAEREAELLQELIHPLFPRYVCHWKEDEVCYLVMEYISGSNLQTMVERRGSFSQQQTVRIGIELAAGLEFLHERSNPIIFRDIKPENVMIREDGMVKLVDVGCACRWGNGVRASGNIQEIVTNEEDGVGGKNKENTLSGRTIAGSRGFAPPEQFSMKENPGRESDVYALGKLLQFLLFGKEKSIGTMNGENWGTRQQKVAKGLRLTIQQAVQEDRQKRIPDMHSFQEKLAKYNMGIGGGGLQRLRALHIEKEVVGFYYVKNVRRGF